jgi:type IV pilus assembly protein PilC
VVLALGTIIITFVFWYIVPQFRGILEEMVGGRLPGLTRTILTLGENMAVVWIGVGILVAILAGVLVSLSKSPAGRRLKEVLLLRVPIVGGLYRNSVLSRMAEAMAVLVSAGCDVPEALRLGAAASGSERLIQDSAAIAGEIERGTNAIEAAHNSAMLPRLFVYSVQLGSQRNELQDNLHSLGDMYADQARVGQSRLQAILLPVLIMAVGCILAIAILSMFLPMIQVVTSLSAV